MDDREVIAQKLRKLAKDILSFDMTEDEWKRYKQDHPGAKRWNHHIIPTPKRGTMKYDEWEQAKIEAKKKYFADMKEKHPNYVPILSRETVENLLKNGEYSCISAGLNTEDPVEKEMAKQINKNKDIQKFVKDRTEQLKKDLDELGVEYTEIAGKYGKEEPSFLISHTLKAKIHENEDGDTFFVNGNNYEKDEHIIEKLNALGAKYNQDSVSHAKLGNMELHYTTGVNKGKKHIGRGTSRVKGRPKLYSEARIGDEDYTMWKCNINFKKLYDNPDFKE